MKSYLHFCGYTNKGAEKNELSFIEYQEQTDEDQDNYGRLSTFNDEMIKRVVKEKEE